VIATAKLGLHLAKLTQVSIERWPASGPGLRRYGLESALSRQIELAGKSGARYRYTPLQEERFLPPAGANFVIAKLTKDGATVMYAGETDNLANQTWRQALEKARKEHSDAAILTRLNVTRAVRKAEQEDLVEEHHPPMNQDSRA
jgi:hypothetical protein